jgi:hypothetical protein
MIRTLQRMLAIAVVLGLVMFGGVVDAKHKRGKHHDSHGMIKAKLKNDGKHQIHKKGKHTVHATVKGGKIHGFHVKHDKKGEVAVHKVKSKKKRYAMLDGANDAPVKTDSSTTGSVGYCYDDDDDGVEDCHWFPPDIVADDMSSATEVED